MLRSGVVSVAYLRGSGQDVAFVDSVFTRSTVVPAVVPDVEVGAEPYAVLGFSALDPLVAQGASAYLDPAFACGTASSGTVVSLPRTCGPVMADGVAGASLPRTSSPAGFEGGCWLEDVQDCVLIEEPVCIEAEWLP